MGAVPSGTGRRSGTDGNGETAIHAEEGAVIGVRGWRGLVHNAARSLGDLNHVFIIFP